MLVVLLAEHRDVGLRLVEQLGDDRGDAGEMVWPEAILQTRRRRPGERHGGDETGGIHLLNRGREDEIRVDLRQPGAIGVEAARIAGEILMGTKLGGIDENRRDHPFGALTRRFDQREVAVMQRAHGRRQPDALAGGASRPHESAQSGDCVNEGNRPAHEAPPFFCAAASPVRKLRYSAGGAKARAAAIISSK